MPQLKKGALSPIFFTLVDRTDFASIESGVTSNFTQRLWGVRNGASAAATAKTPSKVISVVRSGVFKAVLKSTELSDFDRIIYEVEHASCATQILIYDLDDADNSDLLSAITIGNSRVLLNQSRISDVYSLLSDLQSDFQSRVPKRVATDSQLSDLHSDLRSFLVVMSGIGSDTYSLLSDLQSDFQSRVPKRVATDSQLSDLHSDLRSFLVVMSGVQSDVHSGVQLLQSAFVGHTGSTASQVTDASTMEIDGIDHDDQFNGYYVKILGGSQIDELRLVVDTQKTPSHIIVKPAFNSRLLSGVDFVIVAGNPFQSRFHSDVMSRVSDVGSDLRSFLVTMSGVQSDVYSLLSDLQSDFQSRVPKRVATDSQLSDLHSDLRSFLVVMSGVGSDTYSLLSDLQSDFQSRVPKRVATDSQLSDLHSDLRSYLVVMSGVQSDVRSGMQLLQSAFIGHTGSTASQVTDASTMEIDGIDHDDQFNGYYVKLLGGSQVDELRLIVDTQLTPSHIIVKPAFNSRLLSGVDFVIVAGNPFQSRVHSDLRSYLTGMSGVLSDTYSAVLLTESAASDAASAAQQTNSRVLLNLSRLSDAYSMLSDLYSDFQSRVPKRVATDSYLSDVHSDLRSQIGGITASVGASDISDIASAVWANTIGVRVDSRILLNLSRISDVYSLLSDTNSDLKSLMATTGIALDASTMSDLRSAISAGPAGALTVSDISDIASRVWSEKYVTHSTGSGMGSLLRKVASGVSDTYSLLSDANSDLRSLIVTTGVALDASTMSDLRSAINAGPTATVTASDISDIASAVWANTIGARVDSRVLLNLSRISDAYSLLSDLQSDFQSRVPKRVATDSQLSDLHSDLRSYLTGMSGTLSDAYSGVQLLHSTLIGHTGSTASQVTDASTVEIDGIDHDDQFNGYYIKILGGSQIDELRLIVDTQKTPSHVIVKPAFNSRLASGVDFVIVAGNPFQSRFHSDVMSRTSDVGSDLRSYLVGLSATLSDTYSLLSDFESNLTSRVPKRVATDSQLSDLHSDLRSFLVVVSGIQSDVYSLLSDLQSDFQSRVPKRVATDSQLSDLHSDLRSYLVGVSATLSDVESQLDSTDTTVVQANSRLLVNQSRVSDIYSLASNLDSDFQSRVPKRVATDSQLSDLHSDLRSYLIGVSATLSDVYSLASDLQSDFQSRVPKRAATDSQLSNLHSDLSARLPTTLSSGRMRVDVEAVVASATAATNLRQTLLGAVTGSVTAGTLSTTQATTDLTVSNDALNGRLLTFLTGTLASQQTELTDTEASGGRLTFTAITTAPSAGDTFVVS